MKRVFGCVLQNGPIAEKRMRSPVAQGCQGCPTRRVQHDRSIGLSRPVKLLVRADDTVNAQHCLSSWI